MHLSFLLALKRIKTTTRVNNYIFFIGNFNHIDPVQTSRLFISALKPIVPGPMFLGLPIVFQDGIVFCDGRILVSRFATLLKTIVGLRVKIGFSLS
jgi:hypothetical protein